MRVLIVAFFLLFALSSTQAQRIIYSEPDRDDVRSMNFEVIGKLGGQFHIYKGYRDMHYVAIYDAEMRQVEKNRLDFLPDRIFNADFLAFPDFYYMFYQYQKRNIVYCMAVKMDDKGKKVGEPVIMDTTDVTFSSNNRIYTVIFSEDKSKILAYKINAKNDKAHTVTTMLFDKQLDLLRKTRFVVNMPERNDFLEEFQVDNEGDLVFLRASGSAQNDNINKLSLIYKSAIDDEFLITDLQLPTINLDDIRVKVDNLNKKYLITSFFSKMRRGNIDGLYIAIYDKAGRKEALNTTVLFNDNLRAEAKNETSIKTAFNDFYIRNVILRKDGGFILTAESMYSSSRGGQLSRWDLLYGSPFWSPADYYMWGNPWAWNSPWAWGGMNSMNWGLSPWGTPGGMGGNSVTRFYADNVALLGFDASGKLEWSNMIRKSQFDDNTDNFIGFGSVVMGGQIHFLFNVQEKRTMVLSDQSLTPDGQLIRNPTFRNIDKGHDFMPRHAKQVGARQLIMPSMFRNFICFAKIDL